MRTLGWLAAARKAAALVRAALVLVRAALVLVRAALVLVRAALVPAALVAAGTSCNPTRTEEGLRRKQAVARLCWSENRIRSADNAQKSQHLAELSRSPCPAPDACRMRDTCVSAYTLHVDALALTAAAKQLMKDARDGEAAGLLGAAEAKLKLAGPKIEQCTSLSAELRSSYSVDQQ